jgi:hypothetical protein
MPELFDSGHDYANRMSPTHGIASLFQDIQERIVVARFNCIHALQVDSSDALVDWRIPRPLVARSQIHSRAWARGLVVSVAEARTPVAEVGAHDEDAGGVGEVRSQEFSVALFDRGGGGADENGHQFWEAGGIGEVPSGMRT